MKTSIFEAFKSAYEDCPSQDNEGYVPERGSFKTGFFAGARWAIALAAEIAKNHEEEITSQNYYASAVNALTKIRALGQGGWEMKCFRCADKGATIDTEVNVLGWDQAVPKPCPCLTEQLEISDKLIAERNRVLEALKCPVHGQCVPYALEKIAKLERYRQALKTIAGPTYGTELCNTDAENNEILAGHFWRMQKIAKAALEDT